LLKSQQLPSVIADPDRKIMTIYGAYGEKVMYAKVTGVIRTTFIINEKGIIEK
jgi:peroxiredoxin Q/BCP